MILFSSALELGDNININMNILIIDAAGENIFLKLIVDKNIYTCSHDNSKINFEKIIILINEFLEKNQTSLNQIKAIYVNRGPGSFGAIRNSFATIKALFLTKGIDYYCFSFLDFNEPGEVKYENIPYLCTKFKIKKNLINPIYLS